MNPQRGVHTVKNHKEHGIKGNEKLSRMFQMDINIAQVVERFILWISLSEKIQEMKDPLRSAKLAEIVGASPNRIQIQNQVHVVKCG